MPAMTPQTIEWIDRAPVVVRQTRRIPASCDAVWARIADHASWGDWFPNLEATPGPVADAVGGTRTVKLGPVTVEETFLAWEPGARFAFTLTRSSAPGLRSMVEDIQLVADGPDACTLSYVQAVEPVAPRLLGPIVKRGLEKGLGDGLDGLVELVSR